MYTQERIVTKVIVEHGYPHYMIKDNETGVILHCDINELEETIRELTGEEYV